MRLVDAHCHLESEEFTDSLPAVLQDAREAGIVKLVTASVAPEQWARSRQLSLAHPEIECAMGIHPLFVEPRHADAMAALTEAAAAGAVAIGEIGLDKKADSPDLDLQRDVFERQLKVARDLDLPVVVHCRGAYEELLHSIKRIGLGTRGGIIHAFSSTAEMADECIRLGFSISLGGTLTYRNSKKRTEVLRRAYPDHLTLETDSPDMPPVERRGAPNVPANILFNLRAAAETLGEPEEKIAEATTANAFRLFGWE
jgi:TatD DNase family protein